jgi:hypothetical protein
VRFEGEDVWLNVEQMMELFDASQQDVSYHINQVYAECEQDPERTHKKFLLVRQEWPDLDVDLEIDSLRHPERYPLVIKRNALDIVGT